MAQQQAQHQIQQVVARVERAQPHAERHHQVGAPRARHLEGARRTQDGAKPRPARRERGGLHRGAATFREISSSRWRRLVPGYGALAGAAQQQPVRQARHQHRPHVSGRHEVPLLPQRVGPRGRPSASTARVEAPRSMSPCSRVALASRTTYSATAASSLQLRGAACAAPSQLLGARHRLQRVHGRRPAASGEQPRLHLGATGAPATAASGSDRAASPAGDRCRRNPPGSAWPPR